MKKLISILTACLFVFALVSCGPDDASGSGSSASASESSASGSSSSEDSSGWPTPLIKACEISLLQEIEDDPIPAEMVEMFEIPSNKEVSECVCRTMSETFPNIKSLEEMENKSGEEMGLLIIDCFGDGLKEMMKFLEEQEGF